MRSLNPLTQDIIKEYSQHTHEQIDELLSASAQAALAWRDSDFQLRSDTLMKMREKLLAKKEELAKLMALEMGKPVAQGRAEIEKCAACCEYFAHNSKQCLTNQTLLENDEQHTYVTFRPLGVVLAIMPWNFPFWQVIRFLAPNLMVGNTAVLKHASNVTGCAKAIESIVRESMPELGLLNVVVVPGNQVAKIIEDKRIAAVTLTGSTPAGISAGESAAKAVKKIVLELGGSDPYIVFEDADLDLACQKIVQGKSINSGQSCIAAKRFLVHSNVKHEFTQKLIESFKSLKTGDPLDEETQIGPMAKSSLRDELHQQVQESVKQGARLLIGGEIPQGNANFYPPTLLDNVCQGMPAYHEELFGPVGAIIEFRDDEEALKIANSADFGLGSAIFTKDQKCSQRFCAEIEAGSVFVNDFVKSDPRFPFGGVKLSGHGRELGSFGLLEFVNVKTISINKQSNSPT